MKRHPLPPPHPSRTFAACVLFALTIALGACRQDAALTAATTATAISSSASGQQETATATASSECPAADIDTFVAAFAEDAALQRTFSAEVVDTAHVDWNAQPEPAEVITRTPRQRLTFPVMPGREAQRREGLVYRRVSLESTRAVVALEIPDSDAQLLYTFERDTCWRLVKVVDPAFAKPAAGAPAPEAKPASGQDTTRSCGGTTLTLSGGGGPASRTRLRMTGANGDIALSAPEEMHAYTAVGIGCAIANDGAPYFIVEYGEYPTGCAFCEWRYLFAADGRRLNTSDPILLVDPEQPPAQQQYPNNIEFDRRIKSLGLQGYALTYP